MTGDGNHTTYENGDDWGMVNMALFYPHYVRFIKFKNWRCGCIFSRSASQLSLQARLRTFASERCGTISD